jgi:hypothetical protein
VRNLILPTLALLASCSQPAAPTANQAESAAPAAKPAADAELPSAPLPANTAEAARSVVSEAPFTPQSAQGAANVVQTYYALIEEGRYEQARQLRWDRDTLSEARFEAQFAPYSDYHATIGAPSEIQGAAGSSYVEVPVQLYGRRKDGKPFGTAGTITLRRVNDVPGSTDEQRSWHIYTSE